MAMPSVLEKVYAELECVKRRAGIHEKLTQDLMAILRVESQAEFEEGIRDGSVVEYIRRVIETGEKSLEELEAYRTMFPCVVCGKPMAWEPEGEFAQKLKGAVARYGHSSCFEKKEG